MENIAFGQNFVENNKTDFNATYTTSGWKTVRMDDKLMTYLSMNW